METTLLTKENAHRVTMVRRVDAPESEPVAFLFRGKRHGYCSYSHLVGNPGKEEILAPADFKDWEVVEVAHPGYLEEYFKQACSSYNLTSFSPDERGESDIASHEKELHEDLQSMPEQQRERYMENYKRYFSAMIAANRRCASAMITGPARFNTGRNEKACNSHAKSVTAFREWRERALEAIRKATEAAKPEEQRLEEEWQKVKAFIDDAASTIHGIDTGTARGYSRALFVSNPPGDSPPMSTMATWKSSTVPSLVCESGTTKSRNLSSRHAIQSSSIPNSSARCGKSSRNGQAVKIVRFRSMAARWSTTSKKTACKSSSTKYPIPICVQP